jgi:hypothetical protein
MDWTRCPLASCSFPLAARAPAVAGLISIGAPSQLRTESDPHLLSRRRVGYDPVPGDSRVASPIGDASGCAPHLSGAPAGLS